MDYEITARYTLHIIAEDKANQSKSSSNMAIVIICVVDVNEHPVFPETSFTVAIDENTVIPPSYPVKTITANDPDTSSWGDVSYELISGDDNLFSVDQVCLQCCNTEYGYI